VRHYLDIVNKFVMESILSELECVETPANVSQEIGSGGSAVFASMSDMLPHYGVFERNNPQAYAEIFAKATGDAHNDSFEREPAPSPQKSKERRNNDFKNLKSVPKGGDASAILHTDFADGQPNTKSIVPTFKKRSKNL